MNEDKPNRIQRQILPRDYQPPITTDFVYPNDEAENARDIRLSALRDAVHALLIAIVDTPSPKLTLVALAFATGVPLENILAGAKSNSLTDIAAALGCSKQHLHKTVVKVSEQFGIPYGK